MSVHHSHPRRRGVARAGTVLAAATALTAASLAVAGPATASSGTSPRLHWGPCPDPTYVHYVKGVRCASVTVPVDYDHPHGRTMTVEISRRPATDPAHRRGVLLTNPGGPGFEGLSLPLVGDGTLPPSVLARYDLVGFDPRGVWHSSPVTCRLDGAQLPHVLPTYAARQSDVDAYAETAKGIADRCRKYDDGTLRHLTSANTARDLDRVRTALGEPKISYYGFSYGTYLGAVYAQLFPHRTDRVVLDSAEATDGYDQYRTLGPAMELRFPDLAKWIAERDTTYGLGRTPVAVRRNYLALAHRLDVHPQGTVDGTFFRDTVRGGLYRDTSFADTARTWQQLRTGHPSPAPDTAKDSAPTLPEPVVTSLQSSAAASSAIDCNDTAWPRSLDTYRRNVARDRKRYPLFGAEASNVSVCAFWPRPLDPTVRFTDHGPSNILVLQNRRDPATIYRGGVRLRHLFGTRARLVSVDAGGHGVYRRVGSACADGITTRYLTDGTFPAHDARCG